MKKQTFHKAINNHNKKPFPENVKFEKAIGYIYEIFDKQGMPIRVALEYNRANLVWRATEVTTGLSVLPLQDKHKETLLKKLTEVDFTRILKWDANVKLAEMLSDFKESEEK